MHAIFICVDHNLFIAFDLMTRDLNAIHGVFTLYFSLFSGDEEICLDQMLPGNVA